MREIALELVLGHATEIVQKKVVKEVAKEHVKDHVIVVAKEHAKDVVASQPLVLAHALAPVKKRILALNPNNFNNNEKRLFRHPIPPRVLQELRQTDITHDGGIGRTCDSCFCRRAYLGCMHRRLQRNM